MNILWLDQPECQDQGQVGGKAAQLSRLITDYRVPRGFCLPVAIFAQWAPDAEMPIALQAEIVTMYAQLAERCGVTNVPVAVRSSAVDEDEVGASFAGQYTTLLNVTGNAALIDAVGRCWQAAHTPQLLIYRQQRGLSAAQSFAVLVQQMVETDVAAVAFSANPVSGVRDEIVINANWGLGESLVGGQVTPDTYTVRKNDLMILTRQIEYKASMTVPVVGGVAAAPVPVERLNQVTLHDDQVLEIARLVVDLEQRLGWPVDVECAYQGDQLYLLQCRPITTALQATPPGQQADGDALVWDRPEDSLSTWFGGKELVTPLRQSLALYYYQGWAKAFRAVQANGGLRARYVCGYEYRLWEYRDTLPSRQARARQQALEEQIPTLWHEQWLPEIQADLARWRQVVLTALPTDELARHLHEMLTRQLRHWEIHAHMGSAPLQVVQRLVDWYLKRFSGAPESEPYRLVQGQANVSIDGNYALWALSNQVTYPVATALRTGKWREVPGDFQSAFDQYLARFGDGTALSKARTVHLLLQYAEHAVPNPYDELRRLAQERENFASEVRARLSANERKRFDKLLAAAQLHNPLTENHNLYLDQQSDAATRLVCDEFAHRLVTSGILTEPPDVEYLTLYELMQWGFGLADPLRPRVAARKADHVRYQQLTLPAWLGKAPQAGGWVDRFNGPPLPLAAETGTVRGIGASAGVVAGVARVVQTLVDALVLRQGEILVCPATDPKWTPLFALAAGLVTDRGGSLAHAAVVAREYGLPAVVGCHVATQRIATGQRIEVNGTSGVVRLL